MWLVPPWRKFTCRCYYGSGGLGWLSFSPKCERISPHLNFGECVGSSVEQAEWWRMVCQGKKQSELRRQDRNVRQSPTYSWGKSGSEAFSACFTCEQNWMESFIQFADSLLSGFLVSSVSFSTHLLLWRFSSLRTSQWVIPFSPNQCCTWILVFLKQSS